MKNGRRRNIIPDPPGLVRCRSCESNDLEIVGRREAYLKDERDGREIIQYFETRQCNHCGRTGETMISAEELPDDPTERAEILNRPKCPMCASRRVPTRSTQGRKQYRRCRDCGTRFRTIIGD